MSIGNDKILKKEIPEKVLVSIIETMEFLGDVYREMRDGNFIIVKLDESGFSFDEITEMFALLRCIKTRKELSDELQWKGDNK